MNKTTIVATANKGKSSQQKITLSRDLPATLSEMVKVWGEQVVFAMANDTFVIRLQARARGLLTLKGDKKMTTAAIQKDIAEYKPGVGRKPADPKKRSETIKNQFAKMSDSEKAELLKALRA